MECEFEKAGVVVLAFEPQGGLDGEDCLDAVD